MPKKVAVSLDHLVNGIDQTHERAPQYTHTRIPVSSIGVLPQPRRTFQDIDTLSASIAQCGLLNPLIVAEFDSKGCAQYVELINKIWGTAIHPRQLPCTKRNGKKTYFVLLGGERRLRAIRLILENGCEECQTRHGQEPPGTCFDRHFRPDGFASDSLYDLIDVSLCKDISPIDAVCLQLSENIHMPVPSHQEAEAYFYVYSIILVAHPNYPLAQFARRVGRSPGTIKNALRFCALPTDIRQLVEDGHIPYGKAVAIALLQENHPPCENQTEKDALETTLLHWALRAAISQQKVSDFVLAVRKYIADQQNGQIPLFEVATESPHSRYRRVVEMIMVPYLHQGIAYSNRVIRLLEAGLLGKTDSPFSGGSPVRIVRKWAQLAAKMTIHMRDLLPKKAYPQVKQNLLELAATAAVLEKELETKKAQEEQRKLRETTAASEQPALVAVA